MHQASYSKALALLGSSCSVLLVTGQSIPDVAEVCSNISSSLANSSSVAFPGSAQYNTSIEHWALSSTQPSTCTVEPANADELGQVLQIIAQTAVPFGVKSGGHTNNPNFSSTPGVLITTGRFTGVSFDADAQTATIGVGETWDAVYAVLEPHNVSVAGGRVPGVGVGGLIAGGGYAFRTNEFGLGVDTVLAYELVLPNGTVTNVTADSDRQLFWALKGSGNNFGVITRVTMKTFPQGPVWGGTLTILSDYLDLVLEAFANWDLTVTDPKAGAVIVVQHQMLPPSTSIVVTIHYDAATPPDGIFDDFLAIPANATNISTRSVTSLVATQIFPLIPGDQFEQAPVNQYPLEVLQGWIAEVENVASALQNTSALVVATVIEHFNRDILTIAPPLDGFSTPSAWPPTRAFPTFPSGFFVVHADLADSEVAAQAVVAASDRIRDIAAAAGVTETANGAPDAAKYPNYAHWLNTPEEVYGSALPKLRELQKVYDPEGLMKRAGGFKFD